MGSVDEKDGMTISEQLRQDYWKTKLVKQKTEYIHFTRFVYLFIQKNKWHEERGRREREREIERASCLPPIGSLSR